MSQWGNVCRRCQYLQLPVPSGVDRWASGLQRTRVADLRWAHGQLRLAHLCALGQFCTEDVDECQLQPNACHNGGTCFNLLGGHSCVCVNGWTGESCSQNIDDCATAVCFHGATCHDRVASFYCACPMGKTGEWPFSL